MTARRILIIGWLVFALYAYPGYLSVDSIDQLIDSRVGAFTDWHSPMMTEVWRIVGWFVSGPAGMLLLQSIVFLVGAFALFRRVVTERAAAIAAVCMLVFPPVMATLAVIWPQSQLAAYLVACAVAATSKRRAIRIASLGFAFLACGMCGGGTIATLPIIVLGWQWHVGWRRWHQYATATGVWLIIALAALGVSSLLVDAKTDRNTIELATTDIVGILNYAPELTDGDIATAFEGVTLPSPLALQARARASYGHPERYTAGAAPLFESPSTPTALDALLHVRRSLALTYPGAYVAHRWHETVRILGLSRTKQWKPVYTSFVESAALRDPIRYTARHAPVQKVLMFGVRALEHTFLFHPYWYLILALLLAPLAIKRGQRDAVLLLSSGIVYELAQAVTCTTPSFRDSFWLVVATSLAIIIMRFRQQSQKRPKPEDDLVPPRHVGSRPLASSL
ncbi:MAG: hypothetical protein JWO36_3858 [Myxococcales bacterium]|nr:hypothetical protein [Myxococcales bacterium]